MRAISRHFAVQQILIFFGCIFLVLFIHMIESGADYFNGEPLVLSVSFLLLFFLPTIGLISGILCITRLRSSRELQMAHLLGYSMQEILRPIAMVLLLSVIFVYALCQMSLSYVSHDNIVYPSWHKFENILLQFEQSGKNVALKSAWHLSNSDENVATPIPTDRIQIAQKQYSVQLNISLDDASTKLVSVVADQQIEKMSIFWLSDLLENETVSSEKIQDIQNGFSNHLQLLFDSIWFSLMGLILGVLLRSNLPNGFVLIFGVILAYLLTVTKSVILQIIFIFTDQLALVNSIYIVLICSLCIGILLWEKIRLTP